jgi:hypothetical protein
VGTSVVTTGRVTTGRAGTSVVMTGVGVISMGGVMTGVGPGAAIGVVRSRAGVGVPGTGTRPGGCRSRTRSPVTRSTAR